jgi:hypothetical protein
MHRQEGDHISLLWENRLNTNFRKLDAVVWTGFIWLKRMTSDGLV